jgi:8-oxo-dGTP diphosphatase
VTKPTLVVAAAVIERGGEFLITRRHRGVHLEGYWEFPGGKCATGESLIDCLRREILEELAADVSVGEEILATAHNYPDRVVELHFFACELAGQPRPTLGQEMLWAKREDLHALRFPPADAELIARLVSAS